jgi:hypothetical protein
MSASERIDVITELRELDALFDGRADINDEGGPNEAMRIQSTLAVITQAVTVLIENTAKVEKFLTQERWGDFDYMDGSDVYDDLRQNAALLRSGLARVQGEPHGH